MPTSSANAGILAGVGVATQDAPAGQGVDAVELMVTAARAAGDDAGAPALLPQIDRILVTQGTWRAADAGRTIARRLGADRATSALIQLGIPQQALIDQALSAIARGDIEVALVVGGEAKARDDRARRAGIELHPADDPGTTPDDVQAPTTEIIAPPEFAAGFVVPVQQYAAIDNALRAAEGLSIHEHQQQIDALWARFAGVAATNPHAAFPRTRTAESLRDNDHGNRMLAFPYNKWHATQWSVDQAAALLVCSTRAADAAGVDPARRLHPLVSLESSHSLSLTRRAFLHRWPAMQVLGDAAADHLGSPLHVLDFHELYSCFPAAVRVQQRELGLPLDGTPTITGGMAFAGGPFNNFVFQATAAMAERLRGAPGTRGLVTTVSGLLTKPGLAVWSTDPGDRAPLLADLAADAAAATPERAVVEEYDGPASVATYTVRAAFDGSLEIVVIADTPNGSRTVAVIPDPDLSARALTEDLIGTTITLNQRRR